MPELIESLICNAHSHILISLTQIALSSNGTTSLNDFGTSPPTHYIHLHVNTLQVLSNVTLQQGSMGYCGFTICTLDIAMSLRQRIQ